MSKLMTIVFSLLLLVILGVVLVALFGRHMGTGKQVDAMVAVMSEAQTARFSLTLSRPAREGAPFLFGDLRAEGVLDLRAPARVAYDVDVDILTADGRAQVLARQLQGRTFAQVVEGPQVLLSLLEAQGIPIGDWVEIEDTAAVLTLVGEAMLWPEWSPELQVALRTRIAEATLFHDPKATLTEIVHGRVTRIFTAELDADGVSDLERAWLRAREGREPTPEEQERLEAHRELWEGGRVNLWIDQESHELRRMIVQLRTGDQVDIEFENIDEPVRIEDPQLLPASADRDAPVISNATSTEPSIGVTDTQHPDLFPKADDQDGDGLTDDLEAFYGSNPYVADTDGDGYLDGEEVRNGYSPTGEGTLFNFGLPAPSL